MSLVSSATGFVLPAILLVFSLFLLPSDSKRLDSFVSGVRQGMECCINLLPTLLLVVCGVSALFSSGAVDVLSRLLKPVFGTVGIPEELLPTIVLRPFSGSAVTAVADRMFREVGPDSIPSKIGCLLMGSTDTIIYTLGIYFSSANVKKTRYALAASFVVFTFSVLVCNFVGMRVF